MPDRTEQIARITETMLGPEDHGILTAMLQLDYGGSGQGAGGYDLRSGSTCARFVEGVLRVTGAGSWEKVKGHTVLALVEDGRVVGIKGLPFEGGREFLFKPETSDA